MSFKAPFVTMKLYTILLLVLILNQVIEAVNITRVSFDNDGCQADVDTETGGKYHINLNNLKQKRYIFKSFNGIEKAQEIYHLSVCGQHMNITNVTESQDSCLHQMFIYERREPDFIKCSGSGNHSKLILHKDGIALKVFSSTRSDERQTDHKEQVIQLVCSPGEDELECASPPCTLPAENSFNLRSKIFCLENMPTVEPIPPGMHHNHTDSAVFHAAENPDKKRDWLKLSPGSIILLVSGCAFVSYLMLGLVYGIGKGEKGLNRLPNSDFWLELPLLVKDGVKFTFSPCTRPGGGYMQIIEEKGSPIADV